MRYLLFFLFFTINIFSQNNYKFNYISEYKVYFYKDEQISFKKILYLTNSNNNNYIAEITEKDSIYKVRFLDYKKKYSVFFISKNEFLKSKTIVIPNSYFKKDKNTFEFQVNNYAFYNLKDTLYNNTKYSHYKLSSKKQNRALNKKIGTYHYIIDKKTGFHKPILIHPTAIAEYRSKKNIPNGIYHEKIFIDFRGRKKESWKHIRTKKLHKEIIIKPDH